MLSIFPLDVLDEIWDVIESVSEGSLTYFYFRPHQWPLGLSIYPFTLTCSQLTCINVNFLSYKILFISSHLILSNAGTKYLALKCNKIKSDNTFKLTILEPYKIKFVEKNSF